MSMTKEYLTSLFDYKDGNLYWKSHRNGVTVGNLAGFSRGNGYFGIEIDGKSLMLHRVIFLLHHGYLPKYIDHIDGDKSNNSIENLRACTHQENLYNQGLKKNNKSGYKNVSWSPRHKSWLVSVSSGIKHYRKMFKDLELADLVAQEVRDLFHGKFANHGRTV